MTASPLPKTPTSQGDRSNFAIEEMKPIWDARAVRGMRQLSRVWGRATSTNSTMSPYPAWKIKAAAKAGRKLVIVPAENAKDISQVPDEILSQVRVVPVKTVNEVLDLVLEKK